MGEGETVGESGDPIVEGVGSLEELKEGEEDHEPIGVKQLNGEIERALDIDPGIETEPVREASGELENRLIEDKDGEAEMLTEEAMDDEGDIDAALLSEVKAVCDIDMVNLDAVGATKLNVVITVGEALDVEVDRGGEEDAETDGVPVMENEEEEVRV